MNHLVLGLVLLLPLSLAVPAREKRDAPCQDTYIDVPNVCASNPRGMVFFPHPTDHKKYLQCDVYNNMYIVQCPPCQEFVFSASRCQPTSTSPVTPAPTPQPVNNHCTAEGMARGYLYFKVDGDNTKYIECDPNTGSENIISCPSPRVWDMSVLSCVYDTQGGSGHFGAIPLDPNPCTSAAISAGHLYFPYMAQNQFIQCDNRGNAYINTCPFRFSWNAYLQTCFRPVF